MGHVLWDGVRRALTCSEDPILSIAKGHELTFAALSGARLAISWRFRVPTPVDGLIVFVIPQMIASHLVAAPGRREENVDLVLRGNEVRLTAYDEKGSYELHWQSDLHTFPAPPEMSHLLVLPSDPVRLGYLELSDSVHQAVAKLVSIESQQHIHRTKLAILLSLSHGHLIVDGREISAQTTGQYYFDPRLIIRALEFVRTEWVEVGLTSLGPRRAILSIVDRQPGCVVHCALLSIGLDTQRLFPLPKTLRQ